jgi:hypothetical protein
MIEIVWKLPNCGRILFTRRLANFIAPDFFMPIVNQEQLGIDSLSTRFTLAGACSLFAQSEPPVLIPGLGNHHHSISTKSPEAQRFFDQWLTPSLRLQPRGGRAFIQACV